MGLADLVKILIGRKLSEKTMQRARNGEIREPPAQIPRSDFKRESDELYIKEDGTFLRRIATYRIDRRRGFFVRESVIALHYDKNGNLKLEVNTMYGRNGELLYATGNKF